MPRALLQRLFARPALALANLAEEARRAQMLRELDLQGRNVVLRPGVTISHPRKLRFGNNVMVNQGSMIFASGGVTIGDDVVMGPGCMLVTGNHRGDVFYGNNENQPIVVGNNVWLGARVVVTPGARIGNNVIVSAGAVVTGEVADNSIYGGIPARKLKDLVLPFEPAPGPATEAKPENF